MAYPNLSAELRRYGITQDELAERIGRTSAQVSKLMTGKQALTVEEAFRIKNELFPSLSVDYLFAEEPIAPGGVGARQS